MADKEIKEGDEGTCHAVAHNLEWPAMPLRVVRDPPYATARKSCFPSRLRAAVAFIV